MAGLSSVKVREATVVNWMIMGVYFTRELLYKMKKADSPNCLGCGNVKSETLTHFLIHCTHYDQIRETFLPKLILLNTQVGEILDNENYLMLSIIDPLSSKLPETFVKKWTSPKSAYDLSFKFCSNMHRKREKLLSDYEKQKPG